MQEKHSLSGFSARNRRKRRTVKQARRKPGGKFIKRLDVKGIPYFWLTTERSGKEGYGTDVWAVKNKYVAVTPLSIDLTSNVSFKSIEKIFKTR